MTYEGTTPKVEEVRAIMVSMINFKPTLVWHQDSLSQMDMPTQEVAVAAAGPVEAEW